MGETCWPPGGEHQGSPEHLVEDPLDFHGTDVIPELTGENLGLLVGAGCLEVVPLRWSVGSRVNIILV